MPDFEKERVFHFFKEISRIPRESGNEKGISNWAVEWATARGLDVVQDENLNVIIKKPASKGYEKAQPVILQAHMDMVCEKTADSGHDFTKDPIELKVDGDWLCSACGTSLGADDGIGMACAMAALEDDTLSHPPIEAIFTVEEETTFMGAETVSPEVFDSKRMINLDHAVEREVIAGSCGGVGVFFELPLTWEDAVPEGFSAYRFKLCGMPGGHSGEDIHRGRGNAISLMVRVLDGTDLKVVSLDAGTNRLAIPREAEAVALAKDKSALQEHLSKMKAVFRKEYAAVAPELDILLEETETAAPLKPGEWEKLAACIKLMPNGIVQMNGELGVVESSNNVGIVRTEAAEGKITVTCEIRGTYQTTIDDIRRKVELLGQILDAKASFFTAYSPWEYVKESQLRKTAVEVYRKLYGEEMKVLALHAGLECGYFAEKEPAMDIIALGPDCQSFHSPDERVSISSVRRFYTFLTKLLAELK